MFAEAWYNLSDLLDGQGKSEAAIDCLRRALHAAPDYADAMFNLALLLQRNNKHAEAAEYWRRYLASDAQSEWAGRARRCLKFCEMQVHHQRSCAHALVGRSLSPHQHHRSRFFWGLAQRALGRLQRRAAP